MTTGEDFSQGIQDQRLVDTLGAQFLSDS
jgi:hypothetical protein